MEKKELKQITTKVYEDYGFVKKGKYYYLDLEDVLICSGFSHMYNSITYLAYNFSVKAVHSEEEREPNNMFDGYDSWEVQMYFNRRAEGYHKREISLDWDKEYYANKLKELLSYYFDPFKKDALNHIRRCYKEIGFLHENEIIIVSAKAKEFLGL